MDGDELNEIEGFIVDDTKGFFVVVVVVVVVVIDGLTVGFVVFLIVGRNDGFFVVLVVVVDGLTDGFIDVVVIDGLTDGFIILIIDGLTDGFIVSDGFFVVVVVVVVDGLTDGIVVVVDGLTDRFVDGRIDGFFVITVVGLTDGFTVIVDVVVGIIIVLMTVGILEGTSLLDWMEGIVVGTKEENVLGAIDGFTEGLQEGDKLGIDGDMVGSDGCDDGNWDGS